MSIIRSLYLIFEIIFRMCVCVLFRVEVLQPSQPIMVMSSVVSLPYNHFFPGQVSSLSL